jgi:hypothetical protein
VSNDTKVVTLRRCWTIWFDTNGNAPSDAQIVSFATEELANQALALYAAEKDNGKRADIAIGGKLHSCLHNCSVEGYNFDTGYCVKEDWREDKDILTSLDELADLCGEERDTDLPDGVVLTDTGEFDDEENEDDE